MEKSGNSVRQGVRLTRVYIEDTLTSGNTLELESQTANHLIQVLRLKAGAEFIAFNGQGGQFRCHLVETSKRRVLIKVGEYDPIDCESPLRISLLQGLARSERMDFGIQKAVELGASRIIPIVTERTQIRFKGEKAEKKLRHWRRIAISACEQSGRNRIPEIGSICDLTQAMNDRAPNAIKLVLDPGANTGISDIASKADANFHLLVGPEGGLSAGEIDIAKEHGFKPIRLGPRILRTESAGPALIAIIQSLWGDMG